MLLVKYCWRGRVKKTHAKRSNSLKSNILVKMNFTVLDASKKVAPLGFSVQTI